MLYLHIVALLVMLYYNRDSVINFEWPKEVTYEQLQQVLAPQPRDLFWLLVHILLTYSRSFYIPSKFFSSWKWIQSRKQSTEEACTSDYVYSSNIVQRSHFEISFDLAQRQQQAPCCEDDTNTVSAASSPLSSRQASVDSGIQTPYGRVRHCNPALTPANVRESSWSSGTISQSSRRSPRFSSPGTQQMMENVDGTILFDDLCLSASVDDYAHEPESVPGITDFSPVEPAAQLGFSLNLFKGDCCNVYSRSFDRGKTCHRIHADDSYLVGKTRNSSHCTVPGLKDRPVAYVVPGRPRF